MFNTSIILLNKRTEFPPDQVLTWKSFTSAFSWHHQLTGRYSVKTTPTVCWMQQLVSSALLEAFLKVHLKCSVDSLQGGGSTSDSGDEPQHNKTKGGDNRPQDEKALWTLCFVHMEGVERVESLQLTCSTDIAHQVKKAQWRLYLLPLPQQLQVDFYHATIEKTNHRACSWDHATTRERHAHLSTA